MARSDNIPIMVEVELQNCQTSLEHFLRKFAI